MKRRQRSLLSFVATSTLCVFALILLFLHFNRRIFMMSKVTQIQREKKNNLLLNQRIEKTNDWLSNSKKHTATLSYSFNVDDFYTIDLVTNNKMVDKLSPLLKSHHEIIKEAQRIHFNMFKTLIGSYKYAMLFNLPAHENKGDPAIAVGELKLIKKLGLELIFQCQSRSQTLDYAKTLSNNYSSSDLIILMQGGGNLLSYEIEDEHRKLVLERFTNFHVVLFPQSLWPRSSRAHQLKFRKIYASHPRLTFLYRDRPSYELGKRFWPNAHSYLMPDMAFEIGAVSRLISPTHDILWLRRIDLERPAYRIPNDTKGYDVLVQDWLSWHTQRGASHLEDVILRAANGMLFLQRGRVVITDRLHGHILSLLCGIPHVVIDPINHKITSYMKSWTGSAENIIVANSSEDALHKAIGLLKKLDLKLPKALWFQINSQNYQK